MRRTISHKITKTEKQLEEQNQEIAKRLGIDASTQRKAKVFEVKTNEPIDEDEIIREILEQYDNKNSMPAYTIEELESNFFEATCEELEVYKQELEKLSL